jgi:hypothetical protein
MTLVQCHGLRLRYAVLTRVAVRGPAAHDFAGDSPLIGHPQATSFLSIFSIFPMGPGCWHLGKLVKRGNEENGDDLGHLIRGGSSWSADFDSGVLRAPFCAFVVLPSTTVRKTCEQRDKLSGSRIECCQARCGCRGYRVPSFVVRGLDDELAPVLHALCLFLGYSVSCGST